MSSYTHSYLPCKSAKVSHWDFASAWQSPRISAIQSSQGWSWDFASVWPKAPTRHPHVEPCLFIFTYALAELHLFKSVCETQWTWMCLLGIVPNQPARAMVPYLTESVLMTVKCKTASHPPHPRAPPCMTRSQERITRPKTKCWSKWDSMYMKVSIVQGSNLIVYWK